MMRHKIVYPLFVALALISALVLANPQVYSGVPLLGTEEVPSNASTGYGALTAIYDDDSNQLYYEFEWQLGGDAEATAVHFHGPANRGESAGIQMGLGEIAGKSGKQTGVVVLTEAQESDLKAGLWYLNIHSTAFPAGELRGQLIQMSPLESAAVFDSTDTRLRLKTVMVPGLGSLEAEMDLVQGGVPVTFALDQVSVKDFDDDSGSEDETEMEVELNKESELEAETRTEDGTGY